jgi:hypothetical protein
MAGPDGVSGYRSTGPKVDTSPAPGAVPSETPLDPSAAAPSSAQLFKDLFEDRNVSGEDITKTKVEFEKIFLDPNNREHKDWGQGVTGAYPPTGPITGTYKIIMDKQWKKFETWLKENPNATPDEVAAQMKERLAGTQTLLGQARSEARAFLDSTKAANDKRLEANAAPKEW